MKKILTILLIIALALFAFSISGSPLVIIVGALAVMTSVKNFKKSGEGNSESAESERVRNVMDEFWNTMDSFASKNESKPQDDDGEYETRQSGFFTVKYRKKPKTDSKQNAEYKPQPRQQYTEEQAKRLLRYIHDSTGEDTVRIKPSLFDSSLPFEKRVCASKFGGLPYWTRGEEYPKSEDGANLYLLAQINFAEVPNIADFPVRGLLQIFVNADEPYGCSFDASQKDWRIVWREVFSPGLSMSESELCDMGVKCAGEENEENQLPLKNEYALVFEKTKTYCHPNLCEFDDKLKNAAEVLGFFVYDKSAYEVLDEDSFNAFFEDGAKHQIGGYPDFTQNDVRREGDILLFQMDSEFFKDESGEKSWKNAILWGDMGIANFFISRSDLKMRDFSNVLYNWDCG